MNITVLANRDLASNLALNLLLPALAGTHRLTVFLSDAVGGRKARPRPLEELRYFEQTLFNELVFPLVDRLPGHGERLTFSGLERHTAGPVRSLNGINTPEGLETLRSTEPELILSIRYGGILREDAIAIAPRGVINLHSGLLPAYRGVMATFRAMAAGDTEIGCTIHTIPDPGIDTGPIIARTRQALLPGAAYLDNVLALYAPGCEKLVACVEAVAAGERLPADNQGEGGSYFSFPDEQALAEFEAAGHRLVDVDSITALAKSYFPAL